MTSPESAPPGAPKSLRDVARFATDFPFGVEERNRLSEALGEDRLLVARSRPELAEALRAHPETDVICPLFDVQGLPDFLPSLRWVALSSAGADRVIGQPLVTGVNPPLITTANGVHAIPITEHVFSAILRWSRRWPELARLQAERHWPGSLIESAHYAGRELAGETILIIGLGAIGRRIAQVAHAFGMRSLAARRSAAAGGLDPDVDRVASVSDLDTLLPQADFVVIAIPSTAESRGLMSAARLALMKPGAMLINIARGDLVDERALIAALESGKLGAAALDVTAHEPLPADDPLWSTPNMFLSPHISGLTPHYGERLTDILVDNIARYRVGQPMRNLVQPERGY
ncbi:MAG TPA: D-2-hydroxyacid dehydrogenase [Ktedonobacterales bacterium]